MAVPIVIGVGDVINRSHNVEDAIEPMQLMLQAIHEALQDTGIPEKVRGEIDSIDVVKCWTWPYDDLPGLLSKKLNINALRKFYSEHGGNQPGKLFDEAACRISKGQSRVAVITGGEALASCLLAPKLLGCN